jgi:hypothetical protein
MSKQKKQSKNQVARNTLAFSLVAIGVAALQMMPASNSAAALSTAAPSSCQALARDYPKRAHKMNPINRIPRSGHLPFAPAAISIRAVGDGLRVGEGPVGFILSDEAVDQKRRLGWEVRTTLSLVKPNGAVRRVLAMRHRRFKRLKFDENVLKQVFQVSGQPAFHRVDLEFKTLDGSRLGFYSEYFRTVKPVQKAALVLDRESVKPSETLRATVQNLGTATLLPSSEARIERRDAEGWSRAASVIAENLKPRLRIQVPARKSGPCFVFQVPPEFTPGIYRAIVPVRASIPRQREWQLTKQFEVE